MSAFRPASILTLASLIVVGSATASAAQGRRPSFLIEGGLGHAGFIDSPIVDHFTGGDAPAIALVANDTASALLVQLGDGAGMSAPFHDVMTALADADASALAAAQT